jgi:hypothetical protein
MLKQILENKNIILNGCMEHQSTSGNVRDMKYSSLVFLIVDN